MLTLQEMKKAIETLSPEERHELQNYISQFEMETQPAYTLPPEERIRRLDEAAKAIREATNGDDIKSL